MFRSHAFQWSNVHNVLVVGQLIPHGRAKARLSWGAAARANARENRQRFTTLMVTWIIIPDIRLVLYSQLH